MSSIPAEIKNEAVRLLVSEWREDLQVFTAAQVCGLLNVSYQKLKQLPLPKISMDGKATRYRASDIKQFLADSEVRG